MNAHPAAAAPAAPRPCAAELSPGGLNSCQFICDAATCGFTHDTARQGDVQDATHGRNGHLLHCPTSLKQRAASRNMRRSVNSLRCRHVCGAGAGPPDESQIVTYGAATESCSNCRHVVARSARADSASPPQRASTAHCEKQTVVHKAAPEVGDRAAATVEHRHEDRWGVRGWTDIISRLEIGRDASTIARGQQNDGTGRKERTDGGALGCLNSRAEVVTNAPRRAEPNGKMIRRAKGAGRLRIAQSPRKLKLQPRFGPKKGGFCG